MRSGAFGSGPAEIVYEDGSSMNDILNSQSWKKRSKSSTHASRTAFAPPAPHERFAGKNDMGPPDSRWKPNLKTVLASQRIAGSSRYQHPDKEDGFWVDLELRSVNW